MKVVEQILTICGETQFAGIPCALIRFAGCDLDCAWCDTPYAAKGEQRGQDISATALCRWVEESRLDLVLLTGGEPLLQPDLPLLAGQLNSRHTVLVETSGAHDISILPPPTIRSMDIKCPGSGMTPRNLYANFKHLRAGDALKFVITSRRDYDFAREILSSYTVDPAVERLFSAAHPTLPHDTLAGWILEDRLSGIRLNVQMHRWIWTGNEGLSSDPQGG